jgi:TP901 family phage tail tape measure protein
VSLEERRIKVLIDPSAAQQGAARVNSALGSIGNSNINSLDTSIRRLGSSSIQTGASAQNLGQNLNAANNNAANTNSTLGSLNSTVTSVRGSIVAATAAALALGSAFVAATRASTAFQTKMAEVSTLVDTTVFDMDRLRSAILEQAAAFGADPVGTAGAAYQIISAGASNAADAVNTLDVANRLAIGGVTSVEIAADGLTSVVNAYGSGALSAADASDAMFVAMKMGKTTIGELASNLGQVTPLAAQMGVTFDEVTAAVAALTKGGVSTSTAVTGVRAILAAVAKPTKEAADEAARLGIEFDTAAVKSMGFSNWLQHVLEKSGGSTDSLALLFGGVEALVPMLALSGQAGVDFIATMEEMKNKGGASAEAYEKIANTMGYQMLRVFSGLKVAAIELSEGLTTALIPVLRFTADHMGTVFTVGTTLLGGFAAFKAASLASTFLGSANALQTLGAMASAMNKIVTVSTGVWRVFNAAVLANPIVATVAIIGTAIALLYQFRDSMSVSSDGLVSLGDYAEAIWNRISKGLSAIGSFFSEVWGGISESVTGVFESIGSAFKKVTDFFAPEIEAIGKVWNTVFGGIEFSFMGLVKLIARGVDFWISIFVHVGKVLAAVFSNAPRIVGAAVRSVANLVIGAVEGMVNMAIFALNKLIGLANNIPSVNIETIADVKLGRLSGEGLGEALSDTLPSFQRVRTVEGFVDGIGADARANGEARRGQAAEGTAGTDNPQDAGNIASAGEAGKETKAKASALADATKKYQEFLDKMREELEQTKLLKHEAELRAKQEEAKKILGAQYGEIQAQEIANLVEQTRLAKALTGMRQQAFELANETTLLEKALGESDKTRQKFADELLKAQVDHLNNGGKIADLSSEEWKLQEAALITELQRNDALKERLKLRNEELELGKRLFADAGVPNDPAAKARYERDTALKALGTVSKPDGMSQSDFERQMREANKRIVDEYEEKMLDIANKFNDEMVGAIYQIGDALGGVLGKAINGIADAIDNLNQMQQGDYSGGGLLGGIARLGSTLSKDFGTSIDKGLDGFSKEGLQKAFADPMSSMSSSFSKFTSSFSGPNGLVKGVGNAVGGAMAGAAMGTAVAGVGKMLWSKFSTTGAQVGGALGSIAGPIGSAIGSVLGGTIGGLLKKSKQGGAGLELSDGRLTAGSGFGNSKGMTANGMAAAGEVANGINAIADALGATITGTGGISVGQYNDKWRVSTTGATSFKGQSKSEAANERNQGLYNFGEDGQAAAIAFAVSEALKKGVLSGISEFSKRVIQAQGEAGVNLASQYEKLLKELRFMSDPLSSGAQEITQSLDDMAKAMQKSGATAAELGKVEEYRQRKLEQYIDDQLSSLRDFRKELQGEAGGFTSLSLLTRDLADFEAMRRDITAGKTVDQDAFLSLASDINSNAGSIYGSSSAYVDIRNMLADATDGLIDNISAEIDDATVNAIHEQTKNITGQQGITNDLLHQINEQLKSNAAQGARVSSGSGGGRSLAVNGKIVNHF